MNHNLPKKTANRNISFDLLRILSAFAVVVLHTSTIYIERYSVESTVFRIANFYDSLSRFSIPIFVMISGAIFLSEEKTVTSKNLWKRNILRLFLIYCVWSFAYYAFQCGYYWNVSIFHKGLIGIVTGCVYASNHFWFIFMILGLYALVPFLRTWVTHASQKELNYFVLLFMVFQIARTTITTLADKSLITEISNKLTITELSFYLGYFVLGYILTRQELPQKWKTILYALVPVGAAANYLISDIMSRRAGTYHPGIYDSFGLFTCILSMAVFIFFKDRGKKWKVNGTFSRTLSSLSQDTLGIYLLHVGILDYLKVNNILFGNLSSLAGVPIISFLVFAFCALVSAILRRIPFIGRYLA